MRFLNACASLLSIASLTEYVSANLKITADNHSFGGVNYPGLQTLNDAERDKVIRGIVKSGARVIRLFIQQYGDYPDPEPEIGAFDRTILDMFDATLAAIHRISEGQVKVIIAPHNAHALRATNDVPCDAYCKLIDGAFLDFYSNEEIRENYKTRLQVLFKEYPSLNFGGQSWSQLNEVILGVDVQNQPWADIHPIPSGESWLCDIATHMKTTLGLGANKIAVITGGISGSQSVDGIQNFPDSAFDCPAVDVIGIHGYFTQGDNETAGTPWAKMFVPGNTLTARARGKEGKGKEEKKAEKEREKEKAKGKLLLVEEWSYMHSKLGLTYKKQSIFDQGTALNWRGIPWIYSKINNGAEGTTSTVSILRGPEAAVGALIPVLKAARTSRSAQNWTHYLAPPSEPLTTTTLIPLNPFIPEQADCVFGCPGHLCDAADSCQPTLLCKNNFCQIPDAKQPGKIGDECTSKKPCLSHLRCDDGLCQECVMRPSIQPKDYPRKVTVANDPKGMCELDTHPKSVFAMRWFCLPPPSYPSASASSSTSSSSAAQRANPCESALHCSADEYCDWGLCSACPPSSPESPNGCLGSPCRGNNKCKTGFCNIFGRCDYPGMVKRPSGPGAQAGRRSGPRGPGMAPKGMQNPNGANKVRSEALRVNISKETAKATAAA